MNNLPPSNNQILSVANFQDLVSTPFQGDINAFCWKRKLVGDFSEIVKHVELDENIVVLGSAELQGLKLTEQGHLAREILLNDLKLLEAHGASPTLNVIKYYERDVSYPFFPTDVYSFHVDHSPIPTSTFLCTYYGASSDILPNAQAEQKVLIPEIREELKKLYEGEDESFETFLSEYFFDLHYQGKPNARPINLGLGHVWRLACDYPDSKTVPCIHRAPIEKSGQARLMMIC